MGELLETAALAWKSTRPTRSIARSLTTASCAGADLERLHAGWRLRYDYPFEMRGKHMSHVWEPTDDNGRTGRIAARVCSGILEHCAIDPARRAKAETANAMLANAGMRVLAVAGRTGIRETIAKASRATAELRPVGGASVFSGPSTASVTMMSDRSELHGLLGFRDPLRSEVVAAVAACQQGGIAIKLITGDHALTAHAIAEAGILHDDQRS